MVKLVLTSQTAQANYCLVDEQCILEICIHFCQIVLCNKHSVVSEQFLLRHLALYLQQITESDMRTEAFFDPPCIYLTYIPEVFLYKPLFLSYSMFYLKLWFYYLVPCYCIENKKSSMHFLFSFLRMLRYSLGERFFLRISKDNV